MLHSLNLPPTSRMFLVSALAVFRGLKTFLIFHVQDCECYTPETHQVDIKKKPGQLYHRHSKS